MKTIEEGDFLKMLPAKKIIKALEKKNMITIEKVYQHLKDDSEIQGRIQQIKVHPWVRVVEE